MSTGGGSGAEPPRPDASAPPWGGLRPQPDPSEQPGGRRRIIGLNIPLLIALVFVVVVVLVALVASMGGGTAKPGDVLLREDFSKHSGWPEQTVAEGSVGYADGAYEIEVEPDRSLSAFTRVGSDQQDLTVEAHVVQMPEEATALVGIACRVKDVDTLYELGVSRAGAWGIVERPDERVMAKGTFDPAILGVGPVTLRADCIGGRPDKPLNLRLSVNGTVVGHAGETRHRSLQSGGIGVVVENAGTERAGARFDDVVVTAR